MQRYRDFNDFVLLMRLLKSLLRVINEIVEITNYYEPVYYSEPVEQGVGSHTDNRGGESHGRPTDPRGEGEDMWIVMYNSVLVSLIGSLSLRCECLHEWNSACVLHTGLSSQFIVRASRFSEIMRATNPFHLASHRSGRFFWSIERAVARHTETRYIWCI